MDNREDIYYHYCTLEALESILDSKTLWLCDLTESNDAQEVYRAYVPLWNDVKAKLMESDIDKQLLKQQIEYLDSTFHLQRITDIPYGCCFCKEKDEVQYWKEYGNELKGVSIGFELRKIKGLKKQYPKASADITNAIGYENVIYDVCELTDEMYQICYEALKLWGGRAWLMVILPTFKMYASFIKNPSFKSEKETRIVFLPDENFNNSLDNLKKKATDKGNVYELGWLNDGVSALRTITLGTECNATEEDVRGLLRSMVLNMDIEITRSQCSYRKRR